MSYYKRKCGKYYVPRDRTPEEKQAYRRKSLADAGKCALATVGTLAAVPLTGGASVIAFLPCALGTMQYLLEAIPSRDDNTTGPCSMYY